MELVFWLGVVPMAGLAVAVVSETAWAEEARHQALVSAVYNAAATGRGR